MVSRCRNCGGSIEWKIGDTAGVCPECGTEQAVEKSEIYEQAGRLSGEDTEESLEQAMLLYRSIRGWQDADKRYIDCRTRLGRMRWQVESAWLKEEEDRFEAKVARWKKIGQTALATVLLCLAVVTAVSMIRFARYNRASEYFVAGEFGRSAAAFREMADYKNSRDRVYLSAVELYKAGRYEEALPYFVWLDGYIDNGYYLQKCRERLADRDAAAPEPEPLPPRSPFDP